MYRSFKRCDRLLTLGQIRELILCKVRLAIGLDFWHYLLKRRQNHKVLFRLLPQLFTKFRHMKDEGRQKVLENPNHLLYASIDKDSPNQGLENVTQNLTRFKELDFTMVHHEVLSE